MPLGIDQMGLVLGKSAPKQEYDPIMMIGDRLDDGIREALPSLPLVRPGNPCPNREGGVQQQHTLLRPWLKVPGRWPGHRQVPLEFLEHVLQRWRWRHPIRYGKAKAVRLTRSVVGVLPQDHHPHLIERCMMERSEYFSSLGKYDMLRPLFY